MPCQQCVCSKLSLHKLNAMFFLLIMEIAKLIGNHDKGASWNIFAKSALNISAVIEEC